MRRTAFLLLSCAVIASAMFSGGCVTSAMKGTPFYTGEYEKREGAPEDRVNLWPLVYYREPALSVLWPLMELTDEHFALRPVMSVYGLDRDKQVYNVLWPLGCVNQQTGDNRLFPAFWGDDYCNVFPLYWHYGGSGTRYDSLFPAWILARNGDRTSFHFMWPIFHYKNWGKQTGWRVWPLAGNYSSYGRKHAFFAWPLGHVWRNSEDDHGHTLIPLYWYGQDGRENSFYSLPYSRSRGGYKEWDLGIPLFYREKTKDRSSFISPLFFAGRDTPAERDWQCLLPLYYKGRRGDQKSFATILGGWAASDHEKAWAVVPALSWGTSAPDRGSFVVGGILGHKSWRKDGGSSHVLPLYYRRADGDKRLFVSPLYASGKTDGSSWSLVPPFYYGSQNKTHKTFITPLYGRGKALTEDAYWSALMPFYYRDGSKDASRLITLAGAWMRDGDQKSWMVYPLLSGGKSSADSGEMWLGGPLFHRTWDKDGSSHHVLPLYYRSSRDKVFASLPYASWQADDGRRTRIIPPLLTSVTSGKGKPADLWGLGGLVHASWGVGKTPHHVFPVYYRDASKEQFYSLLYCMDKDSKQDEAAYVFPPLLTSYRRDGERKELNALLGLSSHEWGGGHAKEGYTFPLYWYGEEYFYTPMFGWNNNDRRGFLYPLTPLVGVRTGEDKGGWVFPVFSYKKEPSGRVDGSYLLLGRFYKHSKRSGSSLFPVYSYKNYGPIDAMESKDAEGYQKAGKQFWSLPLCWYRNTRTTWPVYEKGKKLSRVHIRDDKAHGVFPLWSYDANMNPETGQRDSEGSLLFFLFDSKHETYPQKEHEYVRKRVLWRIYHYEKLNGDVSVDMFPFITYDRKTNGFKRFSFFWKLFSYQRKEGKLKVNVLFIPFGKGD